MKNNKILVLAVFHLVSLLEGKSQEIGPPKNSLYVELLGSGGLYSVNYERKVGSKLYGRLGFTTFKLIDFFGLESESGDRITAFPVMVTYLSGKGKSHFEIAGGLLVGLKSEADINQKIIDLIAFVGYRYQPPDRGLVFRIGLTPFFSIDNDANYPDIGFLPSAGISIGYHL